MLVESGFLRPGLLALRDRLVSKPTMLEPLWHALEAISTGGRVCGSSFVRVFRGSYPFVLGAAGLILAGHVW